MSDLLAILDRLSYIASNNKVCGLVHQTNRNVHIRWKTATNVKMYQRFTADAPKEGVRMTSTVDPPKKCSVHLDEPTANISPAVMDRKAHSHIFEHFSQYLRAQQY